MTNAIEELVETQEAEKVQQAIQEKYGFTPSLEYCRDLIRFVLEVTNNVVRK